MTSLEIVAEELRKYRHPLFEFEARPKGNDVELCIRSRLPEVLNPEYRITLAERDLGNSQFPWTFQRLLYACLTDYVVELFTESPMTG
jgi:hypothetical protein